MLSSIKQVGSLGAALVVIAAVLAPRGESRDPDKVRALELLGEDGEVSFVLRVASGNLVIESVDGDSQLRVLEISPRALQINLENGQARIGDVEAREGVSKTPGFGITVRASSDSQPRESIVLAESSDGTFHSGLSASVREACCTNSTAGGSSLAKLSVLDKAAAAIVVNRSDEAMLVSSMMADGRGGRSHFAATRNSGSGEAGSTLGVDPESSSVVVRGVGSDGKSTGASLVSNENSSAVRIRDARSGEFVASAGTEGLGWRIKNAKATVGASLDGEDLTALARSGDRAIVLSRTVSGLSLALECGLSTLLASLEALELKLEWTIDGTRRWEARMPAEGDPESVLFAPKDK